MKKIFLTICCILFYFLAANFLYADSTTDAMIILPNGNVGINNQNPAQKLEVNGNIKADERVMDKTGFVMPVGTILPYGGTTVPAGWLLCDGQAYSQSAYPDLYTAINRNFGDGSIDKNGTPTGQTAYFNVPDLRGMFLRGVSGDATTDMDKTTRTPLKAGGNTGNNVGSFENDTFQTHNHEVYACNRNDANLKSQTRWVPDPANSQVWGEDFVRDNNANTDIYAADELPGARISSETRPKNVYVNYIIKY